MHLARGRDQQAAARVFPRKVQSDPALLSTGPADLLSFLRYLEQTRQLRGSGLCQLEAELAEVRPQFAPAMHDTSRFGMAKSLFASMDAEGVDLEDPNAMSAWIEDCNARPYEERAALTDDAVPAALSPLDLVLPPVTLASEEELRRAAEAAPLVVWVKALLEYVGPEGRAVTQIGALRVADAKALAETCGDEERLHRPAHWQREVRRMADLRSMSSWRACSSVRSYLEGAFARFERLGMLNRLGLHVPPRLAAMGLTDEHSTSVSLTPLGVWWLRGVLIENGVRAPRG